MELEVKIKDGFRAFGYKGVFQVSLQDLKRRYRLLSKKYHPDVYGNDGVFLEIQDTYNMLVDEINKNKLEGIKIDLARTLAGVRHGEFAFRYIINGVEYRL